MNYLLISYDPLKKAFYSHKGKESDVTLTPQTNCAYYLSGDRKFVVKLSKGWLEEDVEIGEIFDKKGKHIANIPHPGKMHGKISINGIVSGDSTGFKFVVEPYDNSNSYYLRFDFSNNQFEGAGNTVR